MILSDLPAKIWNEIMLETVFSFEPKVPLKATSSSKSITTAAARRVLRLSQVCSFLREVSHNNEKLWRRLDILLTGAKFRDPVEEVCFCTASQEALVSHFVRLSGTTPLEIAIDVQVVLDQRADVSPLYISSAPLVETLRRSMHRCRTFYIHVRPHPKIAIGQSFLYTHTLLGELMGGTTVSSMRHLGAEISHRVQPNIAQVLEDVLPSGVDIQSAYLWTRDGESPGSVESSPWTGRVRELVLDDNFYVAPLFPNTTHVSIFPTNHGEEARMARFLFRLARLRKLMVYMTFQSQPAALKLLDAAQGHEFPLLEELNLVYPQDVVQFPFVPCGGLLRLLDGAKCTTLRIIGTPIRAKDLRPLLLSNLRVLVLHEPPTSMISPYYSISTELISSLNDPAFLPFLEQLHLLWTHPIDEDSLISMLELRNFQAVSLDLDKLREDVKRRFLKLHVVHQPTVSSKRWSTYFMSSGINQRDHERFERR